jgi:hypothetical protein
MKLPDFELDAELNSLRKAMGAELRDYSAAPSAPLIASGSPSKPRPASFKYETI